MIKDLIESDEVARRCSNPRFCSENNMAGVCAFVRDDGMCLAPPRSWKELVAKLKEGSLYAHRGVISELEKIRGTTSRR